MNTAPIAVDPLKTTTQTYEVPEENLGELNKRIASLSRRSAKLGCAAITLTVVATKEVPFLRTVGFEPDENGGGFRARYKRLDTEALLATAMERISRPMAEDTIVYRKYAVVELMGAVPRLAGWEFVATLQHLEVDGEGINMLRTVPGIKVALPERFRHCGPENCDHCEKVIATRKETFVVRNEVTGEWKQVGRNCTQDFLGGVNPHSVARALECLQQAADACSGSDDFQGGSGYEDRADILVFLEWVTACIRIDGWVSRGKVKAFDGAVQATADQAFRYIFPPLFSGRGAEEARRKFMADRADHAPTDADKELAARALEYAQDELEGKTVGNDYLHNLWVACNQGRVGWKLVGITASLVSHFIKEVERRTLRELEKRQVADSQYVGTLGERTFFRVQVLKVMTVGLDSQFGPSQLHKMVTPEGNALTWFSSGEGLETGKEFWLKATVKAHSERNGVKETLINRADVVTEEYVAAEKAKAERKALRAAAKAAKVGA